MKVLQRNLPRQPCYHGSNAGFKTMDLKAAFADAEKAYLSVNIQAGHISMRTDELEETEALKATILTALKQAESKK